MEGIVLVLVVVGVLLFSVVWLIFPFGVSSGISRIEKLLKKQNEMLFRICDRQNVQSRTAIFYR